MRLYKITKLTPSDVAEAIELRLLGIAWENIAAIIGKVNATTLAANVYHAELVGFNAWKGYVR